MSRESIVTHELNTYVLQNLLWPMNLKSRGRKLSLPANDYQNHRSRALLLAYET